MKVNLPFLQHLGARLLHISSGEARLGLLVEDYHLQHLGYVHGGVISSLADNTGWFAVISDLPEDKTSVTIEIKVNYLKPAVKGELLAVGRLLKRGKKVAFAVVEVWQGSELVAYATGTYAVLENKREV